MGKCQSSTPTLSTIRDPPELRNDQRNSNLNGDRFNQSTSTTHFDSSSTTPPRSEENLAKDSMQQKLPEFLFNTFSSSSKERDPEETGFDGTFSSTMRTQDPSNLSESVNLNTQKEILKNLQEQMQSDNGMPALERPVLSRVRLFIVVSSVQETVLAEIVMLGSDFCKLTCVRKVNPKNEFMSSSISAMT